MEFQKGNWQGAIQLFEGIHLGGLLARMRFFASEKGQVSKKVKNSKASELSNFLHASSLLIEAIYLKARSLQKIGALAGLQFKHLDFPSRRSSLLMKFCEYSYICCSLSFLEFSGLAFFLKNANVGYSSFLKQRISMSCFVSSYSSILASQSPISGILLSSYNNLTLFSC